MTDRLEAMIDAHGLCAVLEAIAGICAEKAAHVSSNWQDKALAELWDNACRDVLRAAHTANELP